MNCQSAYNCTEKDWSCQRLRKKVKRYFSLTFSDISFFIIKIIKCNQWYHVNFLWLLVVLLQEHTYKTLFTSHENLHESHATVESNKANTPIEQSSVRKKISIGNKSVCLSVCVSVHDFCIFLIEFGEK